MLVSRLSHARSDHQSLVQRLRDETYRTQWQSVWALLSVLASRLALLWSIKHQEYRGDSDEDSIVGTLLCVNEASIRLNQRDFRTDLESIDIYPLDLAVALSVSAQSQRMLLKPRWIFPKPLSPNVVQNAVVAHTGSTRHMVAGLMISPSSISSSQFRYGAWVLDPSGNKPMLHTFGIPADLQVSTSQTRLC